MIVTLPIPGFVSVVSSAVFRLPGDGVQLAPSLPPGLINLALLFFRELLVGNEFLHMQPPKFPCHCEERSDVAIP